MRVHRPDDLPWRSVRGGLRSHPIRIERDGVESLRRTAEDLLAQVVAELVDEGYEGVPLTAVSLDMKYTGQNWDITVPVSLEAVTVDEIAGRFDRRHDELYGFSLPEHTHEVLAVRASAVGPIPNPDRLVPRRFFDEPRVCGPRALATRPVWDDRAAAFVDGQIFRWDDLRPGDRLTGASIVEGMDSTVWIPSDAVAAVGDAGDILLSLGAAEGP